jgi:hypothetical protein
MSDDSPTQPAKSKALLITLISVGGALLLAIIILLVVLLTGGGGGNTETLPTPSASDASRTPSPTPSGSDEASPTPTPTPTPTQTEAAPPPPPPPSNDPTISSFTINNKTNPTVQCNTDSPNPSSQFLLVKWSSSNVDHVYFGVGTNDASTGALFENLPPSGNSSDDFPAGYNNGSYEFPCPTVSQKYTLTVVGDGHKVSKSVTVTNNGDQ